MADQQQGDEQRPETVKNLKQTTFMGALARGAADLEDELPADAKDNTKGIQMRLVAFSALLGVCFGTALVGVLYSHWSHFRQNLIDLTEINADQVVAMQASVPTLIGLVVASVVVFLILNILMTMFFTERLIGPVRRFHKHVAALAEGDYSARTQLRAHDAFADLAGDLNRLSESLQQKMPKGPQA